MPLNSRTNDAYVGETVLYIPPEAISKDATPRVAFVRKVYRGGTGRLNGVVDLHVLPAEGDVSNRLNGKMQFFFISGVPFRNPDIDGSVFPGTWFHTREEIEQL